MVKLQIYNNWCTVLYNHRDIVTDICIYSFLSPKCLQKGEVQPFCCSNINGTTEQSFGWRSSRRGWRRSMSCRGSWRRKFVPRLQPWAVLTIATNKQLSQWLSLLWQQAPYHKSKIQSHQCGFWTNSYPSCFTLRCSVIYFLLHLIFPIFLFMCEFMQHRCLHVASRRVSYA